MTVLVTGAAGFIGRHTVHALLRAGHEVVGLDRVPTSSRGERVVTTDLLSPRAVRWLTSADVVVHLAGRPGVRDDHPDAARLRWRDNVLAGHRVLSTVPADVPVIVASSSSVYGGAGTPAAPLPCRETDPRRPRGGYARSKAVLEDLAEQRRRAGGAVTVVRPFTVAGEGQRPDMALSRWIDAALTGRPVTVFGDLQRRRDVTDVRDVAEALRRIVAARVTGTVLNLGTGTSRTLAELLDAVAVAAGRLPPVRVVPACDEEVPATRACTRRCEDVLGFVPQTDLQALVSRQVAGTNGALAA